MKKLFALILALSMVLSLAACGGSSAPETTAAPAAEAPAEAPTEAPAEAPTEAPTEAPAAEDSAEEIFKQVKAIFKMDEPDWDAAIAMLEPLVEEGNAQAMAEQGSIYALYLQPADKEKGYALLEQAIELGNTDAMYYLGTDLAWSIDSEEDQARGMELLKQSAEQGNAGYAWIGLGTCYLWLKNDPDAAIATFEKSAELEDEETKGYSASYLGDAYVMKQNYETAKTYFQQAIDEGFVEAYSGIANMYRFNLNDLETAKEWYEKGIEAGDVNSMIQMGELYEYADPSILDKGKAADLYQMALDAGAFWAQEKLDNLK